MDSTFCEINLRDFTLENFSVLKLAAPAVEVIFQDKLLNVDQQSTDNGQLKCNNLTYPFVKEGYKPCALQIKRATTLVNADVRIRKVIEVELDSKPLKSFDYLPGDTIAILPQNTTEEVSYLLKAVELYDQSDQLCQVQNSKRSLKLSHIPEFTTPRELLRDILNIRAVLKKQFLRALASCCDAKDEEDFLNSLASKEGSQYYNELIVEKGLTLIDLLNCCGSCKPTLALLIEHLPRLLPRPYSIANSPMASSTEVKIIFSVLNERPGVTTTMLASMVQKVIEENVVPLPSVIVYPRQSNNFRYTEDDFSTNQILIAIGTGLAPFLGFLEFKIQLLAKNKSKPGSTWLFVGATVEAAVPHRASIIEIMEKYDQQIIERYFESFSRVPDAAFHYIQEHITENSKELIEFLLQSQTTLYVCADGGQISQTIESNLRLCIQRELNINAEEASEMLKEFRSNGKYREDLWL